MATYYWLGKTGASGNVNNPTNWTLWGPIGACGFLPPSALTGPGYNDTVIFTRYNVNSATYGVNFYPIVSPQGTVLPRGQTAGSGGTGIQYFTKLEVLGDCPVPLGSSGGTSGVPNYFTFKAQEVSLNVNADNIALKTPQGGPLSSYINILDASGITRPNASVNISAKWTHLYYIKGYANYVHMITNVNENTSARAYLENLQLMRDTTTDYNIKIQSTSPTAISSDNVFVYPSTTGQNSIYVNGKYATVVIERGFSNSTSNNPVLEMESLDTAGPGPYAIFSFEQTGYSGASGPAETGSPRTYIDTLEVTGTKISPSVSFYHGVDINQAKFYGGNIYFGQFNSTDTTLIQEGFMLGRNTKIKTIDQTVQFGTAGEFKIVNYDYEPYTPDITLSYGSWILDVTPGGGPTGL